MVSNKEMLCMDFTECVLLCPFLIIMIGCLKLPTRLAKYCQVQEAALHLITVVEAPTVDYSLIARYREDSATLTQAAG